MWAAIIVAVTLLGRWAFSVDTHAQEGGGSTPTVTPTSLLDEEGGGEEKKKRNESPPDCSLPGYSGYPECHGYVPPTSTPEPTSTVTPCRPPHCYDDRPTARPTATPTATARATATATPTNTATPTKTPTPTNTPTITPTPCGGTGGGGSEKSVYPCRTATPTRTPTPTDDDDDDPTPRPTPCRTGGGSSAKDSESTSRCPTPTATHTHTPTPTPTPHPPKFTFTVERVGEEEEPESTRIDSDDLDWYVLQRRRVKVNFTVPSGVNIDDYEFNLRLHSNRTGMYSVSGASRGTCRPLGNTESGWFSSTLKRLIVIRCGVGDGARGSELMIRKEQDKAALPSIRTGAIRMGKHRHDAETSYYFDLSAAWGSRPSFVPAVYTQLYRLMLPKGLKIAADTWNATRNTPFLVPHEGSGVPGITAFGYWYGGSDCDSSSLACTRSHIAPHPHIHNAAIAVRLPPNEKNGQGYRTFWTNDLDQAMLFDTVKGRQYYYLPHIFMHEIGHAMGTGHDLPRNNILSRGYDDVISFPSSDDRIGMNAVLDPAH